MTEVQYTAYDRAGNVLFWCLGMGVNYAAARSAALKAASMRVAYEGPALVKRYDHYAVEAL